MRWLTDPWHYQFFQHGVYACALSGALCGFIGVYVVLRRMSYIGHGLSHSIFGGAAVSIVLSWNFYIGAGAWGVLSALLINFVSRRGKIGADAAIGVVTTASFAIGVAIISVGHKFKQNLDAALFGDLLGVTNSQLWILVAALAVTMIVVFARYRQLLFVTFDPEVADAYGVDSGRYDGLFAVILASGVVSTLRVLGALLVAAGIVIPAIIARLLTDSFAKMLFYSTAIGALCGVVGMYISFHVDVASGATIVLVAASLFTVVFAVTSITGRRRLSRLANAPETDAVMPVIDLG